MSSLLSKEVAAGLLGAAAVGAIAGLLTSKYRSRTSDGTQDSSARPSADIGLRTEDPITESNRLEAKRLHHSLKAEISAEIGSEDDPFKYMKENLKPYVPLSIAKSCNDMADVLNTLESRGHISIGDYSFLKENIFKPASYENKEIMVLINKVETQIQELLEPDSSGANVDLNTPSTSSIKQKKTVYDAVLLYAEDDRNIAIDVLADLRTVSTEYSIVLFDELPLANTDQFEAMDYINNTCRFILIVATEQFTGDALVQYQTRMLLNDFIKTKQHRVVPIWLKKNTDNIPREIAVLIGLPYYFFDRNKTNVHTEIFTKKFKRTIEMGRQTYLCS
ncbi:uncharacterized protein LOC128236595 [Mya arenaria]|uniref:uncharacterized protein LOC128236595 n=1 Tax=Mya arenaria TaxID=6604 RepID=UPI0022E7E959|nr:uncharacterized protein LOC128236595 [Mya arenaria]XP_052807526.1 uncharacterized protein LOC128236595 [Mya arenaria]